MRLTRILHKPLFLAGPSRLHMVRATAEPDELLVRDAVLSYDLTAEPIIRRPDTVPAALELLTLAAGQFALLPPSHQLSICLAPLQDKGTPVTLIGPSGVIISRNSMTDLPTDPMSSADDQRDVLLVVGVWRSGTSLLYALLNQHRQISIMYEGELALLWPLFRWRGAKQWLQRWELWNRALSRHRLDATEFPSDIQDLASACDAAYCAVAKLKRARFRGEKFPSYHDRLPVLARLFPQAKFILIWRNPLGICDSIVRAGRTSAWNRKFGLLHRALMGCEQMILGARQLQGAGFQVHQLDFRELTSNPEAELRKICRFLEIVYEPSMIELGAADRSAIHTSEHHKMVHSDRVVPENRTGEALDAEYRRKIERYLARWRRVYGEKWFADSMNCSPGEVPSQTPRSEPGTVELVWDRIYYRALQAFDLVVVVAFCFAPISLWKRYRASKAALHGQP